MDDYIKLNFCYEKGTKEYFQASLCKDGVLGGCIIIGTDALTYRSEKEIDCFKANNKIQWSKTYDNPTNNKYHRHGIGRALFEQAKHAAKEAGYSFLQVKTVQMGRYEDYDATNKFYLSIGFKEFEVFPTLWDEWNPCQVYVMSL